MTQLALIIDLNVCVGCSACVTSCKEWNTSGPAGFMSDDNPYQKDPTGTFFNRVQTYEVGEFPKTETVHFPKSCLHCEEPPCVPVCPTGASYKRELDGIVLVDYDKCIGCKYCSWACPYGAREIDEHQKVMKKCTLCVDRIYDEALPEAERKPACVLACPTNARLFGDVHDADSEVSEMIRGAHSRLTITYRVVRTKSPSIKTNWFVLIIRLIKSRKNTTNRLMVRYLTITRSFNVFARHSRMPLSGIQ